MKMELILRLTAEYQDPAYIGGWLAQDKVALGGRIACAY
jgi:hypothetical protein